MSVSLEKDRLFAADNVERNVTEPRDLGRHLASDLGAVDCTAMRHSVVRTGDGGAPAVPGWQVTIE